MKKIILCFFISVIISGISNAQDNALVIKHPAGDYLQGTINIKIHPQFRDYFERLNNALPDFSDLSITGIHKKFPNRKPLVNEYHKSGKQLPDLSLIYELEYEIDKDAFKICEDLMTIGYFEYAEPHFVSYMLTAYTPSDPRLQTDNPYHFNTMQLYDAWGITKGDSSVVIGYTDTSFDLGHEDLIDNVKYNYADPINLINDDLDGYTDNYKGWDMVDNDNDVYIANEIHGTSVAAVGSATGDNNKGYLGSGFKCKFLPVKVANNAQVITKGYEGITYCVEHGAKIVNCSWGNTNPPSQLAQDVINDATLTNNVLIIASAGNTNDEAYYYPASYEYVLSVTGVDANDLADPAGSPTPFTHNDSVDVSAPGFNVYSTARVSGVYYYQTSGGTSLAAPLVAGVAGLVWAQFPCLTAIEVMEQIKATTDNIDNIPENIPYIGKIGTGRVNAYQAVLGNLCSVSVDEREAQESMVIYPNPASNNITLLLKTATNSKAQLSIVNAVGEQIIESKSFSLLKGNTVQTIDVSGLAAGIYFVNLMSENQSECRLFIKSE